MITEYPSKSTHDPRRDVHLARAMIAVKGDVRQQVFRRTTQCESGVISKCEKRKAQKRAKIQDSGTKN